MAELKLSDKGDIKVADVTIAQLSRGLYRSTATAFKELVSNAYDADATEVRIDVNFPEFDFISCVDNGVGMTLDAFVKHFSLSGIGSCTKRRDRRDRTEKFGRPVIGKLGIGMLAIGQLSHSFHVESHYKDKDGSTSAFRGEIVLLDSGIPDLQEGIMSGEKEIEVGKWSYEVTDYDERKQGFRIYTSDVRGTFSTEMKRGIRERDLNRRSFSLESLHKEFYDRSKKSIRDCGPYLETIWELAILSPLPYYGSANCYPVNLDSFSESESSSAEFKHAVSIIRERQRALQKEQFSVVFDGIELRRHVQLPTHPDTRPKVYPLELDEMIMESRLKLSGYVFAQIPRAICPLELNGIQIRLRNVGIGGYDSTFLKYYKEIETIRSRWVSGEVFVEEGLESALNIDRDSFNEHDEHYKRLQTFLHERLDPIFNEAARLGKEMSEGRHAKRVEGLGDYMQETIRGQSKGKFRLKRRGLGRDKPSVSFDVTKGEITLNTDFKPSKKKKVNEVIQAVEVAYFAAREMGHSEEARHEFFRNLLMEILTQIL